MTQQVTRYYAYFQKGNSTVRKGNIAYDTRAKAVAYAKREMERFGYTGYKISKEIEEHGDFISLAPLGINIVAR